MRRVVICSPWKGNTELHSRYLDACLRDSYSRGEAPIAFHAIGPRVLRDDVPDEREIGISAGLAWIHAADAVVVYSDLGISEGMQREIAHAEWVGVCVEYRKLGGAWAGKR